MFRFYGKLLAQHPFLTQAATTGFLFASGDVIAQQLIEAQVHHDWRRTRNLTMYGGLIGGPAMVLWYRFLARNVSLSTPLQTLLARVALDQGVFAPVFLGVFFTYNGYMEGSTFDEIKVRLRTGYPSALAGNYMLWPAVQFFNFKFVPLNYQALTVNTVALGWNSFLSVQNKKSANAV